MAIYREDIVDIDLTSGTLHRSFLNHSIGKGDNMENRFGVRLFRDGSPVSLDNCTCQGYFIDPQGIHIAITGTTLTGHSGNVAWVQLPQACYNYEGQFTLAIKVVDTSVTGTMRIIDGMICNTGSDSAVAPTGTVPTYQEVLSLFETVADAADDIAALQSDMATVKNTVPNMYYVAYGGTGVHWEGTDPVVLTLDTNDHYLYINGERITITSQEILDAAELNTDVTVSGHTISGHTYCIYYDFPSETVKCGYGNSAELLTERPVIFATHYSSFVCGLLVDFIERRNLTNEENFNDPVQIALNAGYRSITLNIPEGTTENINLNVSNTFLNGLNKVNLYYTASSGVYAGNIRIDKAGYEDTIYLDQSNAKKTAEFRPTWVRLYYDNMVKSGGSVIGGNITLYYKYVATLADPYIGDDTLDEYIDERINDPVPDYFETNIATAIASARANMNDVGRDGETFVFITDPHWETNAKNSPSLVGKVLSNLNIHTLLCGGDIINQGEKTPMLNTMQDFISAFKFKNVMMPCAFGNHDSNWNDWDGQREHPERKFDAKTQYAMMQKQAEGIVNYFTSSGWNFCMDIPATKTRIIVLDTGEDSTFSAYSDLITCMSGTPSGYHIIMMAHWLAEGSRTTACTNFETLIDAYNSRGSGTVGGASYNFASAGGEVFLLLGGHYHNDKNWSTSGGVPVVLTDTDSSRTNNTTYPYVAGTITEQAFDIFTINYSTKAVKAVRVGRGADRAFRT